MNPRSKGPQMNLVTFLDKTSVDRTETSEERFEILQIALKHALHEQAHGGDQVVQLQIAKDGTLSAIWLERAPVEWNDLITRTALAERAREILDRLIGDEDGL